MKSIFVLICESNVRSSALIINKLVLSYLIYQRDHIKLLKGTFFFLLLIFFRAHIWMCQLTNEPNSHIIQPSSLVLGHLKICRSGSFPDSQASSTSHIQVRVMFSRLPIFSYNQFHIMWHLPFLGRVLCKALTSKIPADEEGGGKLTV